MWRFILIAIVIGLIVYFGATIWAVIKVVLGIAGVVMLVISIFRLASDEDEELLMGMPDLTILPGIPYPPGDSQQYRISLMDCRVAGTQYQSLDNVKKLLYHRAPLKLVREEHNKYDEYAVAVHFEDDDNNCSYKIGYVPRSLSRVIAVIMDAGWSDIFEAEIDGFKMHADKNESIHMSIYVLGTREKR